VKVKKLQKNLETNRLGWLGYVRRMERHGIPKKKYCN